MFHCNLTVQSSIRSIHSRWSLSNYTLHCMCLSCAFCHDITHPFEFALQIECLLCVEWCFTVCLFPRVHCPCIYIAPWRALDGWTPCGPSGCCLPVSFPMAVSWWEYRNPPWTLTCLCFTDPNSSHCAPAFSLNERHMPGKKDTCIALKKIGIQKKLLLTCHSSTTACFPYFWFSKASCLAGPWCPAKWQKKSCQRSCRSCKANAKYFDWQCVGKNYDSWLLSHAPAHAPMQLSTAAISPGWCP